VGVVGDLVGQVDQLGLEAGTAPVEEAPADAAGLGRLQPLGDRAGTALEDALAGFEAQVQPSKSA
jgi:hypothetical protein